MPAPPPESWTRELILSSRTPSPQRRPCEFKRKLTYYNQRELEWKGTLFLSMYFFFSLALAFKKKQYFNSISILTGYGCKLALLKQVCTNVLVRCRAALNAEVSQPTQSSASKGFCIVKAAEKKFMCIRRLYAYTSSRLFASVSF